MSDGTCQWWAMCTRPATGTRTAPWGEVPICTPCAARVDELEADPRAKAARRAKARERARKEAGSN